MNDLRKGANPLVWQQKIDHPSAWRGGDFAGPSDYSLDLTARQVGVLEKATAAVAELDLEEITQARFDLSAIAADVADWRQEILQGRGFIVFRGLPVERHPVGFIERLYWGLGTHFGRAVSQSLLGDRLGHIVSVSGESPEERGYRSNRELSLHSDNDDIVGMLCVSPGASGGGSVFVSALAIHNVMLAECPELLAPLYRGFRYHWRGEQAPGEPPITEYRIPVLSERDGVVSTCFLREFITMAAEDLGEPLSEIEQTALERFGALCDDPDLRLDMTLQAGDLIFLNNYTMLHGRAAFVDGGEKGLKRHLMRLWLKVGERPIVPELRRYYGEDGLPKQQGKGTLFDRARKTVKKDGETAGASA